MSGGKGRNNLPSDRQLRTIGGPWQPLQDPLRQLETSKNLAVPRLT